MTNVKIQITNKIRSPKPKTFLTLIWYLSFGILILANSANAATLYLIPSSQTVYLGDTFIAEVRLDTEGKEINAIEANLEFSRDLLKVVDLSKGNSILSLWVKDPGFSNTAGTISFTGGKPKGFEGDGSILKITFLVKEIGQAKVDFKTDSQAFLHDGRGTPAQLFFLEGSYEIIKKPENLPLIFSPTHSDQNKWSRETTLHLHWDLIEAAFYSYLLSQDPLAEPDDIPDKPEGELLWIGDMEYPWLEDGIYYFTLKQKLLNEDWSKKVTFRAMVDTTPPEQFTLEIAEIEGKQYLVFSTIDKTSGVDHYEVFEQPPKNFFEILSNKLKSEDKWQIAQSPYLLEDQELESIIKVKAVDKAGNTRIAEIVPPEKPFPWLVIILVLVGVGVVWWIIQRRKLR